MDEARQYELGKAIARAAVWPLHQNEILTYDMEWPEAPHWQQRPVRVTFGPATVMLGVRLVNFHRDLAKATRLNDAIGQAVARTLQLGYRTLPIRVYPSGEYLVIEVPNPEPWLPTYPEAAQDARNSIIVGYDQRNVPMLVNLEKHPPGIATYGRPGSGKTNLLRLIGAQAAAQGWALYLVDAAKYGDDWHDFEPILTAPAAYGLDEARALLEQVDGECAARQAGQRPKDAPLLLIVDELIDLPAKPHQELLSRLVRTRRSAGLRVLLGAQRCGKEIDNQLRSYVTVNFGGLLSNETESQLAIGEPGCERLLGNGDMLLSIDGMPAQRVQTLRADPEDLAELLRAAPQRGILSGEPEPTGAKQRQTDAPGSLAYEYRRLIEDPARAANDGRNVPPIRLVTEALKLSQQEGQPLGLNRIKTLARGEPWGMNLSDNRCREVQDVIKACWDSYRNHPGASSPIQGDI